MWAIAGHGVAVGCNRAPRSLLLLALVLSHLLHRAKRGPRIITSYYDVENTDATPPYCSLTSIIDARSLPPAKCCPFSTLCVSVIRVFIFIYVNRQFVTYRLQVAASEEPSYHKVGKVIQLSLNIELVFCIL